MTSVSLKNNFAYKSILTLSSYIMAFITFPYITRVLGVANVGLISFVDNTINYFLLFSTLGIGTLGIREIAAVKGNKQERDKVFSNLLGMNIIFTSIVLIIYFILVQSIPKLSENSLLFYIGASKIVFSTFLVEWFFTGIENFKYITIRSLLIKVLYVLAVFIFVQTPSDYTLYFILTISTVTLNSIINTIYSRKFVKVIFKELYNLRFLKSNFILGIYTILTSMYLTFNVVFLGFVSSNIEVGYYTTAFKLYQIILGIYAAFTSVMLPRMSSLLSLNEKETFHLMIKKSFNILYTFSIPLAVCTIILAPDIIQIIAGNEYEPAIKLMQLLMPLIIIVGTAQILAIQVITPLKKDSVLLFASITGATLSIILNIILVKNYQSLGSIIVLICSECTVTIIYIIYSQINSIVKIPTLPFIKNIAFSIPAIFICFFINSIIPNIYIRFIITTVTVASYFLLLHYFLKTDFIYPYTHSFLKKLYK